MVIYLYESRVAIVRAENLICKHSENIHRQIRIRVRKFDTNRPDWIEGGWCGSNGERRYENIVNKRRHRWSTIALTHACSSYENFFDEPKTF